MKNILLLVHDDEGQEARLQAALDVTRALGGHLTCLDVIVPPAAVAYDACMGTGAAELMTIEYDREKANRTRLEERLGHEDVSWSWHEAVGFPTDALREAAGLADLVVVSTTLSAMTRDELRNLAGPAADRSERPVLAVPPSARGVDLCGTVVVAWDGSRQADEALRCAVPLLGLATETLLLDLDEPDGPFAVAEAASYLSRHGVRTRIEAVLRSDGEFVYSTILDHAHKAGAAYIVMGAFGHSQMAETVFGGVTRSMLNHSDLPLFLAH